MPFKRRRGHSTASIPPFKEIGTIPRNEIEMLYIFLKGVRVLERVSILPIRTVSIIPFPRRIGEDIGMHSISLTGRWASTVRTQPPFEVIVERSILLTDT